MELGKTPKEIRQAIRQGRYTGGTAGLAPGFVQANLVVLPRAQAYDFLVFCQRNPKPCPLIEVTDPGNPEPAGVAPGADLRTDVPRYRVYREGRLEGEGTDITEGWRGLRRLPARLFVHVRDRAPSGRRAAPAHRGEPDRLHVADRSAVPAGRDVPGPDGRLDAPDPRAVGPACRHRDRPLPHGPWIPRAHRRPGADRHRRR